MISESLVEDVPRLGTADVRTLLPADANQTVLELDMVVDGVRRVQSALLTATHLPQPGARRWWWRCPTCGRRCSHLYLVADVQCRSCAGVRYVSQYLAE